MNAIIMEKHSPRLRTSMLLPLMVLLQIQSVAASPFPRRLHDRDVTITSTDCPPNERHPPPTAQRIDAIEYATVPPAETDSSDGGRPGLAWQIQDGQVQIYSIATASAEDLLTSATTVTGYDTNTPVPRGWTPPGGSEWSHWAAHKPTSRRHRPWNWHHTRTSVEEPSPALTTTPVVTSQSPTSETSASSSDALPTTSINTLSTTSAVGRSTPVFTTSVPDSSLTSLSTSEVQTVTGPPPTGTSGVSTIPFCFLLYCQR